MRRKSSANCAGFLRPAVIALVNEFIDPVCGCHGRKNHGGFAFMAKRKVNVCCRAQWSAELFGHGTALPVRCVVRPVAQNRGPVGS